MSPKMPSRTYNLRQSPNPSLRAQEAGIAPKHRSQQRTKVKLVNYSLERLGALYRREMEEGKLRQQIKEVERELRHLENTDD